MNANLFTDIASAIADHPTRPAIRAGETTLSYADLDDLTARAAGLLRDYGVEPGDRVAVMLPNVPAFATAYYGALRTGAIVVPMNPLLKSREIDFYLRDPQVKLLFAWESCRDEVELAVAGLDVRVVYVVPGEFEAIVRQAPRFDEVVERAADDTAVLLYTSGTTGKPKGAELTHGNISRNAEVGGALFGLTNQSVVIGALPLFHCFGQTCGLNAVLSVGGQLALVPRFDPAVVLETIEAAGATIFMGVPTMYTALLHDPSRVDRDTSTLALCVSGGAALPVEVLHAFEADFGCVLLEGYGLSETSPLASFNRREGAKPGSIGVPVDGVEMRIVDDEGQPLPQGEVGEIAIKGHNVMKGYWRRPEETAAVLDADGWFRSGDMGRTDDEGFFYIVDRKKDLIIRGGYNVYPREIEEVLYEHPAVRECAVIGLPDPVLGEEIGAAVALTAGADVTEGELREYVRERVAAYKYPRHVWLVDDLPKGPTNKILKREIVAPAAVTT